MLASLRSPAGGPGFALIAAVRRASLARAFGEPRSAGERPPGRARRSRSGVEGLGGEFGAGENDPVDLLFPFCTPDSKKHTAALQALANFLEEEENVERLRGAGTSDEVIQLLKEHEE